MLKVGRVTKVKVLFLVLVFVFNFDLFKFSAAGEGSILLCIDSFTSFVLLLNKIIFGGSQSTAIKATAHTIKTNQNITGV